MKLIIDISEEAYNEIKTGMRNSDDMREVGEAIENGTPIPNTNGEIIMSIFPNGIVYPWNECNEVVYEWRGAKMSFQYDWWYAPTGE